MGSKGLITEPQNEIDREQKAFDTLIKYLDPLREQPLANLTYKEAVAFLQSPLFKNKFKASLTYYLGRENMGTHTLDPLEEATFQTLTTIISSAEYSLTGNTTPLLFSGKNREQIAKIKRTAEAITPLLREAISPQDKSQLLG